MVAVAVAANNTRVEDAEATTGWGNRGGGAGVSAEAPLAYQGSNLVNRKVTSSTGAGFEYDPVLDSGSAQDMTAAAKAHWMFKHIVSDSGGLRSNDGVRCIIGDGTNEYAFITAGTDAIKAAYDQYLLRNSLLIVPVNPNISGYRDSTHSGTGVSLTAVDQFGIDAEFSNATAKSENVGVDAIDLGTGLTLTGGDGVSTDGVWQDFVDEDEGTVGNRWGYANSLYSNIKFFFGQMTIGSASATVFVDTSSQVLWPDGLFAAGFSRAFIDLQNASSDVTDGAFHTSLGTTNVEDTRADYVVSGTSGVGLFSHALKNFRNVEYTSACTVDGADIECADLTQGGSDIQGGSNIRCNSATQVAVCNDANFANIDGVNFIQVGSGHAIEITSAGSYDLTDLTWTGFGGTRGSNLVASSGANDAAIYNNSGGAVTLNVSGGDQPSIRNAASSTTTVSSSVSVTITVVDESTGDPIENARVRLGTSSGATDIINNLLTNSSGVVSTTFSGTTPQTIDGVVAKGSSTPVYKRKPIVGSISSSGFFPTIGMVRD